MMNAETDANASAEEEDEDIWFQPLVEERSLFEPTLQEYFTRSPPRLLKHLTNQSMKPVSKLANDLVDSDYNSVSVPLKNLGAIDGKLPKPCQDTLDELIAFVESFDVSEIVDATPVKEIKRIVVTGATGFVGRHFVADLLKCSSVSIETIYCPVRASDDDTALQRLVEAMEEAGTWNDSHYPRLCVFKGDLQDEYLGTSSDLYEEMVHSVDAVYHFASNLNLAATFEEMRKSNCISMRSVLRLCLSAQRKHLFLASTCAIFPQYFCQFGNEMADKQIRRDAMPEIPLMKKIFPLAIGGYGWSKLINELAAYKATQSKGLPLAVFRLPVMFTNSKTGYSVYADPMVRLFFASLQMRLVPGKERPFVMEDSALSNEMMLRISLNPNRKNTIYHCSSPSTRF
jgi:thioester reductase-like protein